MDKLSLICDQCGSVDIELIDENIGKCCHCGTKFLIVKKDEDTGDEVDFETIQGCYGIKPNKDIEWFKRNAIIDLFLSHNTPLDINEATFGDVYENVCQSVVATIFYEGECIADVGYLSPFASKYSYNDDDYSWQPFKRYFKTDVKSVTVIDEGEKSGDFSRPIIADRILFSCMKGDLNADEYMCKMEDLGVTPTELTDETIKKAINDNKKLLGENIDLPGDTQRIISLMGSHKVVSLIRVAEKHYVLPGEYKGEKFEIVMPAGGDKVSFSHLRKYVFSDDSKGCYKLEELGINDKNDDEYENKQKEFETEEESKVRIYNNKRKKELKTASKICACIGFLGVLTCYYSFLIGALIIGLSIGAHELFNKLRDKYWEKIIPPLEKKIKDDNPLKLSKEFCYKLKKLEEVLSEKGFEHITEDEIKKYADNHKYTYGISRKW